ncbi:MAG: type II toxin-antitoxin system death-on-curing family toxin [Alphaproteobacteria bacterium]|nr:type II toxin-antitoxin system death-on-curing family toxin [Alphaproteobacteria bacterium]
MKRWRWLQEAAVIAIHGEQIAEHGGEDGIRDAGLLSSALARPQNKAIYAKASRFDLAAAYAFGIARNHPFVDGNKRAGFLAAYVFLDLNGAALAADETSAVEAMLSLASGKMKEKQFSDWLKAHSE